MGTVRPGPLLAGELCNSRAWKWAAWPAKGPRPAAAPGGGSRPPGPLGPSPRTRRRRPDPARAGPAPPPTHTPLAPPLPTRSPLGAAIAPTPPSTPGPAARRAAPAGRGDRRPCCRRGGSPAPRPPAPPSARPLTFGAADLAAPSGGRGGNESCHGVSPRGPLASRTREAPRRSREGLLRSRPRPSRRALLRLLFFSLYYLLLVGGAGGGGRLRKRGDVCNFSSLFLSPPQLTPRSALKKHCWKGRGTWGGGGTRRGSGEVMIVVWKTDQSPPAPNRDTQKEGERRGVGWGGGLGGKRKSRWSGNFKRGWGHWFKNKEMASLETNPSEWTQRSPGERRRQARAGRWATGGAVRPPEPGARLGAWSRPLGEGSGHVPFRGPATPGQVPRAPLGGAGWPGEAAPRPPPSAPLRRLPPGPPIPDPRAGSRPRRAAPQQVFQGSRPSEAQSLFLLFGLFPAASPGWRKANNDLRELQSFKSDESKMQDTAGSRRDKLQVI